MTTTMLPRTVVVCCVLGLVLGGAADQIAGAGDERAVVRVAIYDDSAEAGKGPVNLLRILTPDAGFSSRRISSGEIRQGMLADFDVLIMPGGSGSKQAERLQASGCEQIRDFVRAGGGYVGICAGSYLASSHYDWSLGLINARVWDRAHWARGGGDVSIRMSDAGWQLLGRGGSVPVRYNQGPLLVPDDESDLPGYEVLATFETAVADKGAQPGSMVGTHAIIRSMYGQGRVICYSPHPEAAGGPNGIIASGVRWAGEGRPGRAGRQPGKRANPSPS
ncbi:MAG: BPL-N domain-containing protein [Planctomycetaceae bacterium]